MHALLVIHDPTVRLALEGCLATRGWSFSDNSGPPEAGEGVRTITFTDDPATERCSAPAGEPAAKLVGICWPGDQEVAERFLAAGADDLIPLPIHPDQVALQLRLLERRCASSLGPELEGEIERRTTIRQAFLEGLFEASPEAVVLIDEASRILRINGEFVRMFGYAPEEAEGRALNELIVPLDLQREGAELDWGVQRGERVAVETVRRDRDGQLLDVSVLAAHIDVDGPVGAIGIYRDITEKKKGEAALRESEARYRALFDQSPVGVFLCDGRLRITHCNTTLARMVGIPYEEILGAHLVTLRDRRLIPGLRAALNGRPASYGGPYRSRSGDHLHVSIRYAPLRDGGGSVVGGMGVMEDITERVEAERQLRAQTAEMERVNAALRERTLELEAALQVRTRLYTAMNHELRTPISAVMLYQELLMAGSLGPLGDEQLRALENSHTATSHLLELVKDILNLSKIEAGKVSVHPERVAIAGLLDDLVAAVTPLAERHGSLLIVRAEEAPGEVVTDPQRVRQILLNFVSNAAKFGRKRPIEIRSWRRGEDVVVEVRDQGIGIAPEDLTNIFEDFVQLSPHAEEGTGLGLAISKRLADLLGAAVEVESEVGVGSTFRLVLPPAEVEAMGGKSTRYQRSEDRSW